MIWSGATMRQFLGEGLAKYDLANQDIMSAIETALLEGTKIPDLGGSNSTSEVGDAILNIVMT